MIEISSIQPEEENENAIIEKAVITESKKPSADGVSHAVKIDSIIEDNNTGNGAPGPTVDDVNSKSSTKDVQSNQFKRIKLDYTPSEPNMDPTIADSITTCEEIAPAISTFYVPSPLVNGKHPNRLELCHRHGSGGRIS